MRISFLFIAIIAFWRQGQVSAQLSGCDKKPCQNGGICLDQPNTLYGYSCQCIGSYYGNNCQYSRSSDSNKPIVGGAEGTINQNPNPKSSSAHSSNSGSSSNVGRGSSVNINPNGDGGVSIKGSDINIGGAGSGSSYCLNGGYRPSKPGLPCICQPGFTGTRCEFPASGWSSSFNNKGYCSSYPCLNNGRCVSTSTSYYCECPLGYNGPRCEYYSSRGGRTSYGHGYRGVYISLMPMLLFCCLASLCIYFCCARKRHAGGAFMGLPIIVLSGHRFANRPACPMQAPCSGGYYAPPPQGPGVYAMRQQTVPLMRQDPDEVFKVNMSPPPYEQVVQKF